MEWVVDTGLFVLNFLVVVATAIGTWFAGRRHRVRKALEPIRLLHGGEIRKRFLERPALHFDVDGVPAVLRFGEKYDPAGLHADLQFQWTAPSTLEIVPETLLGQFKKLFGGQDILVDDEEFDSRYRILGSSPDWVRRLLDPDTRKAVNDVAGLAGASASFQLQAGPAGVSVRLGRNLIREERDLVRLVTASVELLRRMRGVESAGVRLVSAEEAVAGGRCPVCAQTLDGRIRSCSNCHTAHHEECWEYFGRCGMYACGSVRARPARSLAGPAAG